MYEFLQIILTLAVIYHLVGWVTLPRMIEKELKGIKEMLKNEYKD